jgi:hypothetical protein
LTDRTCKAVGLTACGIASPVGPTLMSDFACRAVRLGARGVVSSKKVKRASLQIKVVVTRAEPQAGTLGITSSVRSHVAGRQRSASSISMRFFVENGRKILNACSDSYSILTLRAIMPLPSKSVLTIPPETPILHPLSFGSSTMVDYFGARWRLVSPPRLHFAPPVVRSGLGSPDAIRGQNNLKCQLRPSR